MKKMSKRLLSLLLVLCMAATVLAGCGETPQTPQEAPAKETASEAPGEEAAAEKTDFLVDSLKYAGGPGGMPNPFLQRPGGGGDRHVRLLFDSLLDEGDKEQNAMIPLLADDWSLEGTTYHFTLNPNALWHDNVPVTARDVAFSIAYYQEHTPVANLLCSGDYHAITDVKVLDDLHIDITFDEILSTTTTFIGFMYVIPEHIWKDVEDPLTFTEPEAFMGCGMYDLTSMDATTGIYEYTAFEPYYGGKQVARQVMFRPVSDGILAFENGEIDVASITPDVYQRFKDDPDMGLLEITNGNIYEMLINFERVPALLDLETRQAVFQAIDLQGIVDNVLRGAGSPGSAGFVPPTFFYYTDNIQKYPYDPEAARAVLEGKNISFKLATTKGVSQKICEMIQKNLAEVGVTVTLEDIPSGITVGWTNGDYDTCLMNHGAMDRTPDYLRTTFSSNYKNTNTGHMFCGPFGWDSEIITQLGEELYHETDPDRQMELYHRLQEEISKEIPVLPIVYTSMQSIYRKSYYDGYRSSFNFGHYEKCRVNYLQKDTMRPAFP